MSTEADNATQAVASPTGCELCGRADAVDFAGQQLCVDCIQISGSCCAEQDEGDGC